MRVVHNRKTYDLHFNENGHMFSFEYASGRWCGEVAEYICARTLDADDNQCWLLREYLNTLVLAGVVAPIMRGPNLEIKVPKDGPAVLCEIIHPAFNDGGYGHFGDFCRSRLHQQCQYGSRYILGEIEGYPALGEGLRFNNGHGYRGEIRELDAGDYHAIRIHRDDMDEFERRYRAYLAARESMFD